MGTVHRMSFQHFELNTDLAEDCVDPAQSSFRLEAASGNSAPAVASTGFRCLWAYTAWFIRPRFDAVRRRPGFQPRWSLGSVPLAAIPLMQEKAGNQRSGPVDFSVIVTRLLQTHMLRETNTKDISVELAKAGRSEVTWGAGNRNPQNGSIVSLSKLKR